MLLSASFPLLFFLPLSSISFPILLLLCLSSFLVSSLRMAMMDQRAAGMQAWCASYVWLRIIGLKISKLTYAELACSILVSIVWNGGYLSLLLSPLTEARYQVS
ncbi:hypothetical protein EDD37DRAFT_694066 [Exophiala viscosa]|uniref:Uncharacterized protein n=1 Tax=Exophiala viscosa TaxID=2486360 RepID=A0AAN6DNX7_9EURO|nr:hypothetical protein EDD36DRAFT_423169 [Exophiala viscosa]KAI1625366.1 hypothetical protein EDD37DRAFT_694066 [Exophiala viscosa]